MPGRHQPEDFPQYRFPWVKGIPEIERTIFHEDLLIHELMLQGIAGALFLFHDAVAAYLGVHQDEKTDAP